MEPKFPGARRSWDLPDKRNYAVSYARSTGYSVLLLLDDDIGGLTTFDVRSGYDNAQATEIFGLLTGYFPDDSVTGHVAAFLGTPTDRFVSGNCLFVKVDSAIGHFAGIYNEDWLFVLSSDVARIGTHASKTVTQRQHMKWLSANEAMWQEPGEFITAAIVDSMAENRSGYVFDREFWISAKSERLSLLTELRFGIRNVAQLAQVVDAATIALQETRVDQVLRFIEDFANDSSSSRARC